MNIIKITREAALAANEDPNGEYPIYMMEKFASLVRAEALEEAASVATTAHAQGLQSIREAIAAAIRGLK
jgi:hypothetical protein